LSQRKSGSDFSPISVYGKLVRDGIQPEPAVLPQAHVDAFTFVNAFIFPLIGVILSIFATVAP